MVFNAVRKTPIRKFGGKILGYMEEDAKGNFQIRNFYGRILGVYYKDEDQTRDFYGRIIGKGNLLTMLLNMNESVDKKPSKDRQKEKK